MGGLVRRTLPLISLLLVAFALSCCGKGNVTVTVRSGTASPSPSRTTQTQQSPRTQPGLTRARALAFAAAVNLRESDVPGLHPADKAEQQSSSGKAIERELEHCVGVSGANQLAEAGSKDFEHSGGVTHFDVSSNVSVSKSAALATSELAKLRSGHAKDCLKRYMTLLFKGSSYRGAVIGPVSIAEGSPPAAGASGSIGLRISTSITIRTIRIPFYLDILGFVYGPAEVSLLSSGLPVPFPAATQQRLFLSLLARAKAHRL
jgi:hypothetical protein